jgi:Uma2 family endonuclease
MNTTKQIVTAEELLKLPKEGFRYELIQGELKKMSPAGHYHGRVAVHLTASLAHYVKTHQLGFVYAAETGFKLSSNPDTVRTPDVAFIRKEKVQKVGNTDGFWLGAPDLAVEVVSPSDTYQEVEDKVDDWLQAGPQMVIVLNPRKKSAIVYHSKRELMVLTEEDEIEGEDVIPGWKIKVADLFI